MARLKEDQYIFAEAFIGCAVRDMMSRQDLMRLANASDFAAAESILQEFGYGESKEVLEGDVESFIRREQNKLYQMIYNTLPERAELAMFLYPFDYHNVKVCLKAELLGITPDDNYLMSTGDIDWMKMVAMIRDRNYMFMPERMKNAIIEATDIFSRGSDPQEIDIIMDKACYADMLASAEEIGDDYLIEWCRKQIDILNIRAFVRLREIGKPWSFFQKVYMDGGYMQEQFFTGSWEEPYSQVADKMAPYGYRDAMAEGCRQLKETGDFLALEQLLAGVLMEHTKKAKYMSFGIEPIAGYWLGKEIEIDNLRIVLTGKLIGSTPEEIGERLLEPYV